MNPTEAPPTMAELEAALDALRYSLKHDGVKLIAERTNTLRALFARAIVRPAVEAAAWNLASDLNRDLREERDRLKAALANVMAQHPHTARCVCGSCEEARAALALPAQEVNPK